MECGRWGVTEASMISPRGVGGRSWSDVSLRSRGRLSNMADNQRSWWQQWTDTTYIRPLNRLVGGSCLAALPKLGIPGWDEA